MSDTFVIDTEVGIKSKVQEDELEILQLYDDNHPMLSQKIPLYAGRFPNPTLTVLANSNAIGKPT